MPSIKNKIQMSGKVLLFSEYFRIHTKMQQNSEHTHTDFNLLFQYKCFNTTDRM